MENGAKALIVAGTIFIVLILFAGAIILFNSLGESEENSVTRFNQQEIRAFNAQFEVYSGNSIELSRVKDLLTRVIKSNELYTDNLVKVNDKVSSGDITIIKNSLTKTTYKVELNYNANGLIDSIKLTAMP